MVRFKRISKRPYIYWDQNKLRLLKENQQLPLSGLARLLVTTEIAIAYRMTAMSKREPENYSSKIACEFRKQSMSPDYLDSLVASSNKAKDYTDRIRYRKEYSYKDRKYLKEHYLDEDWRELQERFGTKEVPVHIKLIEMHLEKPDIFKRSRVARIAKQANLSLLEELRLKCLRDHLPKEFSPLPRYQTIDSLIDKSINANQIAKKLHLSKQAVFQYINSRGLRPYYQAKIQSLIVY